MDETEEEDFSSEEDRIYAFSEIKRKLKKIIAIRYDIPRREIFDEITIEELSDLTADYIFMDELIEDIEEEFDVFLDADLFSEDMSINEITKEILDMMDE